MRAITQAQAGVLAAGVQGEHYRLSLRDPYGVWRDLTTYAGFNAIESFTLAEKIENPHRELDVRLLREMHRISYAPGISSSPLNRAFNPAAGPNPLVRINAEVKLEIAITPMDKLPGAADWMQVFYGKIDDFDPAKGYGLEFGCRAAPSGRLAQQFIKTERVYSFAADGTPAKAVACRIWDTQITVAFGEYLVPATRGDADPGFGRFLKCSQGGITGLTEPVWTGGANQVDGTAKWDYVGVPTTSGNPLEQILQNILDDARGIGDGQVLLYTPTSPGWDIRQFLQQREHTLDAVLKLAQQIGWDIRSKWREAAGQFELTLYQPDRGTETLTPTLLYTFAPRDFGEIETLAVKKESIRNNFRCIYPDRTDLWPDGTPKRKVLELKDDASIAKYEDMFAEIQEDETSGIDSPTEATKLLQAALSDCKEPTAQMAVPLKRCFPWVELNDFYKFSANNLQYDTDLSLAVTGFSIIGARGKLSQKLQLRGLPTIGSQVWIERTVHPEHNVKGKAHRIQHFQGGKTPGIAFLDTVGGMRAVITIQRDKGALIEEYEHHLYPTPGTSLDSTTLKTISKDRNIEFGDLASGETYYHRVVPRTWNGDQLVRGQPSVEVSFVAGYLKPIHVDPTLFRGGELPPNGSFESFFRGSTTFPPDHWDMVTGTWQTDVYVEAGAGNVFDGSASLLFKTTVVATKLRSKYFPVPNSAPGRLSVWVKKIGTPDGTKFAGFDVEWYDRAKSSISTTSKTVKLADTSGWYNGVWSLVAPSTACFARIACSKTTAANHSFYLDAVRLQLADGAAWHNIGDTGEPAFTNSWVNYNTASHSKAAYRFHANGDCELKGLIMSGTIGSPAFTLPVAPPKNWNRGGKKAETNTERIEVDSSGNVTVLAGDNAYVSLDGMRFSLYE